MRGSRIVTVVSEESMNGFIRKGRWKIKLTDMWKSGAAKQRRKGFGIDEGENSSHSVPHYDDYQSKINTLWD